MTEAFSVCVFVSTVYCTISYIEYLHISVVVVAFFS